MATDIYKQKSNWKIILFAIGVAMLLVTLFYSNFLAKSLRDSEDKNKLLYELALNEILTNKDLDQSMQVQDSIVQSFALPVIMEDESGNLIGYNFGVEKDINEDFLRSMVDIFIEEGNVPIQGTGYTYRVYVFNSKLVNYITYFPLVQVLLVGLFIAFGYYLFSSARKAEQNRVWAGMAKETAHQLGTPISAILAWIEHLKESSGDNAEQMEIIGELSHDVNRLELVADRFSKIGSAPELTPIPVKQEIQKCIKYMQRRAPRKMKFDLQTECSDDLKIAINEHLFDWVVENLYRNGLDAMEATGSLSTLIEEDDQHVIINISDTGKGIPSSKFKTVFEPGYSTKQRGWGLGLSLAKRIVENYHAGKIFVKSSKINEGTTFTIKLPKV